ncbi:hypothetical protein MMC24_005182 [Lignoscripta atroalba]|nr:hypothetical protein [Lignoscripta atroalba]
MTILCLLQIFVQAIIEGFSYTYLGVFAGFITGTLIIVASRLQNLSDSTSHFAFPFDAFCVWGGFILGSLCSGYYGTRMISRKIGLSQLRGYQLKQSVASVLLVAAAVSTVFLNIDVNSVNIDSPATYSLGLLLSAWSGFSFSSLKLLQVPDLSLPICTGAVNTLFYDHPRDQERLFSVTFRRISLVITVFWGVDRCRHCTWSRMGDHGVSSWYHGGEFALSRIYRKTKIEGRHTQRVAARN